MIKVSEKKNIIRILQIGMHDAIGGVETYLMNYYRNIDKSKIQFDFINPYNHLCFDEEIKKLGGIIYNVSNFKKNPFGFYKNLVKIIQDNHYQIVHINMLSVANILPILAAKRCNVKHIIVHSHNSNIPCGLFRKVLNMLNKKCLNFATDFFACSNLAGKWMFGKKNYTLIYNAIDCSLYKKNIRVRLNQRNKLCVNDKFVIGHVGRFSFQKNHEFLIDVFYEIQKSVDNAVLLLIGEGELKDIIIQKVKQLGIANKVIFLGTTNQVHEYLQAMDVFVLPSKFEGLPVVGIEAQVAQLKCFFSDSITEEAKIIKTSEFISNLNLEQWVSSIIKYKQHLIKDKNKESLKISQNYDIKYAAQRLEKIYERMI